MSRGHKEALLNVQGDGIGSQASLSEESPATPCSLTMTSIDLTRQALHREQLHLAPYIAQPISPPPNPSSAADPRTDADPVRRPVAATPPRR